jgi:hypothetical protein
MLFGPAYEGPTRGKPIMSANSTLLEDRVAVLELEVSRIRDELKRDQPVQPWWDKVFGVFADDEDFEEAMRLGREYRESLRPPADEQ